MNNEIKEFPPTNNKEFYPSNKQYALKIFNLTDDEEEIIGAQLAKIFLLKQDKTKEYKSWKLGGGYINKTNKGLTRTFISIIDKINEGRNLLD